jgi:tRNA(Ile)-lysidine synthase
MIRNLIIPQFKKFDDNVMLKFQTTIDNLNSTKIFADVILSQTKKRIFIFETDKIKVKIEDLKKLDPVEYYVHHLFNDYKFDFKEIIKLFDSDTGKYINSNTHIITKNKKFLIITKND